MRTRKCCKPAQRRRLTFGVILKRILQQVCELRIAVRYVALLALALLPTQSRHNVSYRTQRLVYELSLFESFTACISLGHPLRASKVNQVEFATQSTPCVLVSAVNQDGQHRVRAR